MNDNFFRNALLMIVLAASVIVLAPASAKFLGWCIDRHLEQGSKRLNLILPEENRREVVERWKDTR